MRYAIILDLNKEKANRPSRRVAEFADKDEAIYYAEQIADEYAEDPELAELRPISRVIDLKTRRTVMKHRGKYRT